MRKTVDILGVKIDSLNMNEALEKIVGFTKEETLKMVFTPNSEMIMVAKEDSELENILNSADLNLADGIGVVMASKILGESIPERVTGFDTMLNLFKLGSDGSMSFYFFGAAPGVAELAEKNLKEIYPKLNIVGMHNGYFDEKEEKNIIDDINRLKPDILFVGFGAPKQEKWIYKHREELRVKVCIGIGGSIDIVAGTFKRAPVIFQRLGLEWFYRFAKQPVARFRRMLKLPQFALNVFYKRIKG